MNVYKIIKLYRRINSPRLKLAGILALHILRRRYLNVMFDPVLACNLRCRMCHFSDPEARKNLHGVFSEQDIQAIANAIFHRVVKLQIGCGAEPTLFKRLPELIRTAASRGVPYISVTTNGQLLTTDQLRQMAAAGLNELTLSAHGISALVYEDLMPHASHQRFLQTLDSVKTVRQEYPNLRLRLNYTVNESNVDDLKLLPQLFADLKPNVIQLRPIQKISNSDYDNFSVQRIISQYNECIMPVVNFCQDNNITCLYPELSNLCAIGQENEKGSHLNGVIDMLPYFQLSPYDGWKDKMNPYKETFEDYSRRTYRTGRMFRLLFGLNTGGQKATVTKSLNYNIK